MLNKKMRIQTLNNDADDKDSFVDRLEYANYE